jgi:dienelactone hydrolase
MNTPYHRFFTVLLCMVAGSLQAGIISPCKSGPFPVETTNLEVADAFATLEPEQMDRYLIGAWDEKDGSIFWDSILKNPEDAWIVEVEVPEDEALYETLAGETLPVVVYVMYPTEEDNPREGYTFPHPRLGASFEHMTRKEETPLLSKEQLQYPLVILCHGIYAHSLYDVKHAEFLASQGYIVASISFGDGRIPPSSMKRGRSFIRPLEASAVLEAVLNDPVIGPRVNLHQIGISGHSFGGFTVYTSMGARKDGEAGTVHDDRFAAGVAASPWTGGYQGEVEYFPFTSDHSEMRYIDKPMLTIYGSADEITQPKYVLGASKQVQGPAYLVELRGEGHIYSPEGWADVQQWELMFFDAYLKGDKVALETLKSAESVEGGCEDFQHFDYRKNPKTETE